MTERKDFQTAPCDGGGAAHVWSGTIPLHYSGGQYTHHVCRCKVCGTHGLYYKHQTTAFDEARYASELGREVLAHETFLRNHARHVVAWRAWD